MLFETTIKNLADTFGECVHDIYKKNNDNWYSLVDAADNGEFDFDFCLSADYDGETWFGVRAIKDGFDGDQVVLTFGELGIGIASVCRVYDADAEYVAYDFKNMIIEAIDNMGYGTYHEPEVVYIDYPDEKEN